MASKRSNAISPSREENFPEWYQQVVKAADLAENSPVRGCMIVKPWGYALWEEMQRVLDDMFKSTGHVNAYFPLLIPLSFLEKEAAHVDGFAKECAVVTHHRLEADKDGKLVPAGKLEEPLVIRPTSETIIGQSYAKWIQSYRDLPILINQWANVMRWEMRTRVFLRTSEFLWQEGHTAHATEQEARAETLQMLGIYTKFVREYLAIPVIPGEKTPDERFPGAVDTYTIESMMQDRKALQCGTSHFLGQNFSRAQGISFLDEQGEKKFAWTTSWGVTTRLIGAVIMTHGDDDGIIIPPKIASQHAVILPIYRKEEDREAILEACRKLQKELNKQRLDGIRLRVHIDDRDIRGGEKTWQHIKKGIPLRIEIGPRDLANQTAMVARRDESPKQKTAMSLENIPGEAVGILESMQENLYQRAKKQRDANIAQVENLEEFERYFKEQKNPGFIFAPWHEDAIDHPLLAKLKVTPRCLPIPEYTPELAQGKSGTCLFSGKPSERWVLFGKSY